MKSALGGPTYYYSLLGFLAFTRSDYTASLYLNDKIRPLKLLKRSENARKGFSVLKGPLLSEGKFQQLLKLSRNLLMQRTTEKN